MYHSFCLLIRHNKEVHIKLSGDGTYIGKRIHCVLFSFTLLEETSTVSSVDGIHPLAVFREPEAYSSLELSLEDIIKEVSVLQDEGITVQDEHYKVN